jgi:hypothetical protein
VSEPDSSEAPGKDELQDLLDRGAEAIGFTSYDHDAKHCPSSCNSIACPVSPPAEKPEAAPRSHHRHEGTIAAS